VQDSWGWEHLGARLRGLIDGEPAAEDGHAGAGGREATAGDDAGV